MGAASGVLGFEGEQTAIMIFCWEKGGAKLSKGLLETCWCLFRIGPDIPYIENTPLVEKVALQKMLGLETSNICELVREQ